LLSVKITLFGSCGHPPSLLLAAASSVGDPVPKPLKNPGKAHRCGKISRAQAITPLIEAGKVFLPEFAPWLSDYLDEMAAFPMGVHDDSVDSTTQALNYLRRPPVYEVHFSRVEI
jgi:hypothetical protein